MRRYTATIMALAMAALFAGAAAVPTSVSADALPDEQQCGKLKSDDPVLNGWCTAITRRKGNCLACHGVTTQPWPETLAPGGNIGPPLVAMKQRFPDKAKLRAQVYDATKINPQSVMPPFGKNNLLSDQEIDLIVEWLYSI